MFYFVQPFPLVHCDLELVTTVRKDLAVALRDLLQHGLYEVQTRFFQRPPILLRKFLANDVTVRVYLNYRHFIFKIIQIFVEDTDLFEV